LKYQGRIKKAYRGRSGWWLGVAHGVCGYAENVGKNSSNKFEISGVGKKRHIGESPWLASA
jgi:hypothetical protein